MGCLLLYKTDAFHMPGAFGCCENVLDFSASSVQTQNILCSFREAIEPTVSVQLGDFPAPAASFGVSRGCHRKVNGCLASCSLHILKNHFLNSLWSTNEEPGVRRFHNGGSLLSAYISVSQDVYKFIAVSLICNSRKPSGWRRDWVKYEHFLNLKFEVAVPIATTA